MLIAKNIQIIPSFCLKYMQKQYLFVSFASYRCPLFKLLAGLQVLLNLTF